MKTYNKINKSLGIDFQEEDKMPFNVRDNSKAVVSKQENSVVEQGQKHDETEDYHLARNNLHNLLNVGNKAMEDLAEVCRGTEQPRAFEVLSNMMKTMADTSKDLYEIQEKSRKIREMDNPRVDNKNPHINVEKGVFVGTAADLLKELEEEDKAQEMKTIENDNS